MKYAEIKNLEIRELYKRLVQTRRALFAARMKHKMKRLSNVMELRYLRRDIARLQFALSLKPFVHVPSKKEAVVESATVHEKVKTVQKSLPVVEKKQDTKKADKDTVDLKHKVRVVHKKSQQSSRMDSKLDPQSKNISTRSTQMKPRLRSSSPMKKKVASSAPVQQGGLAKRFGRLFQWGKKDSKKGK